MKKKVLLSFAIAMSVVFTSAMPALAAPVAEADAPQGEAGERPSNGAATIFNDFMGEDGGDGEITYVIGDDSQHDDEIGREFEEGEGGAEINVWAKVIETGDIFTVYCVDIEWGNMKFVYSNNGTTWDTESHTYNTVTEDGSEPIPSWWIDSSDSGKPLEEGEEIEGFLDGENNLIIVTNHSNGAIDAEFSYGDDGKFNATSGEDDVVGGFYGDNDDALAAALVLEGTVSGAGATILAGLALEENKVSLPTAVGRAPENEEIAIDTFFAFSGMPDKNRADGDLTDFEKVGVITVTVTPNADETLNEAGDDGLTQAERDELQP